MKRLIQLSSFIIFLGIIFTCKIYAASWSFKWENTTVDVLVNSNISDYKEIPKAYLYKDDVLLENAYINYNREGDWLYFLSDVDTSRIGSYYVWYKASENIKYCPGTCTGYKCLITFNVIDNIAPSIKLNNEKVCIRRGSDYNFLDNVIISDNYTKIFNEDNVVVNSNFNKDLVGSYDVEIIAIDSSKNSTKANYKIEVFDDSTPIITFLGNGDLITVGLNSSLDISSYFQASDDIDGDLSTDIYYPYYDTSSLGAFYYTVSVSNKSGNTTEYTIIIDVVDDQPPVIILTKNTVILNYKTDFEVFDFKKYILKIIDNTTIDYSNLLITTNVENEVGSYYVNYSYTDGIFTIIESLDLRLVSKEKPVIEYEPIIIKEGNYIDLYDYVSVTDDSDPNVLETLVINDDNVNYKEEGTYFAEAYAINSSGLSVTKKVKVVVEEDDIFSTTVIIFLTTIFTILFFSLIIIVIFFTRRYMKKKKEEYND